MQARRTPYESAREVAAGSVLLGLPAAAKSFRDRCKTPAHWADVDVWILGCPKTPAGPIVFHIVRGLLRVLLWERLHFGFRLPIIAMMPSISSAI